jgi:indolepyruvate ferredoxin oxidoreductase, beta subunit
MSAATRPITVLVAALGGEGGGVLTSWIVAAAEAQGLPVQSTSIPGVAQRTGATTYYIEIVPVPWPKLGGKRPVLALAPGVGDVDVVLASELMEAGRAIAGGFVSKDRTLLVSSTQRVYLTTEKMAMGDGRYDQDRLIKAAHDTAQTSLMVDMEALARESGAIVNAVMLGLLAGCGRLPIPVEEFEAAIRADGKAVESNLKGFRAGLAAAKRGTSIAAPPGKRTRQAKTDLASLEHEIATSLPEVAREIMTEGVRRLAAYQDVVYARLYLDRLDVIRLADTAGDAKGKLLRETARHLAVRMSFEDVIRVAQAKIAPERFARIEKDMGVNAEQPYAVVEYLKPGIEEMCQILPAPLARRIIALAERHNWLGKFHVGMEINSRSISGYLRFLMLAKLRRWRRWMYRYQVEQAAIEAWLTLIADAARVSSGLALEVAECARLIKGYGDTHKRGTANYETIVERVIRPTLARHVPAGQGVDAVASARTAALVDPDGESLARCLAEFERQVTFRMAAE